MSTSRCQISAYSHTLDNYLRQVLLSEFSKTRKQQTEKPIYKGRRSSKKFVRLHKHLRNPTYFQDKIITVEFNQSNIISSLKLIILKLEFNPKSSQTVVNSLFDYLQLTIIATVIEQLGTKKKSSNQTSEQQISLFSVRSNDSK